MKTQNRLDNEAKDCIRCKTKKREATNKICSSCRMKEWRKNNPNKIKAYLERSKEHREKVREEYAKNNRELIRESQKNHYINNREDRIRQRTRCKKNNGYAYEKSQKGREYEAIRRKTNRKYPLKGEKCKFCDKSAEEHHHTTDPITVDDFIFVCKYHHNKEHGKECRDLAVKKIKSSDAYRDLHEK